MLTDQELVQMAIEGDKDLAEGCWYCLEHNTQPYKVPEGRSVEGWCWCSTGSSENTPFKLRDDKLYVKIVPNHKGTTNWGVTCYKYFHTAQEALAALGKALSDNE